MNIKKQKVYVPDTNKKVNKKSFGFSNFLFVEMANYGYSVSEEILNRISKLKPKAAKKVVNSILKEYTVGELNKPLFDGWENRTEFTFEEVVCQIFGYIFQISGNDLYDESFMNDLKAKVNVKKVKFITLISDEEFKDYFNKLINASGTLDRKTTKKLEDIFEIFGEEIVKLPRIKSAEMRIAALLAISKSLGLGWALKALKCDPVDALRYAAAVDDFEAFKLPSDVKYANLKWADRVSLFSFLNSFSFEKLCESMGLNRGAWERFFAHTHLFGQKGAVSRFNNLYTAAFVSVGNKLELANKKVTKLKEYIKSGLVEVTDGGNLAYRTFASRIQSAIEDKNWPKIKELCNKNRSYILRNLSSVSNSLKKKDEYDFIEFVKNSLDQVSPNVLFSILTIDTKAEYRIIDIKGNTVVEDAKYPEFINKIQDDIRVYINRVYGFDGKVKVEKGLKNNAVPFLSNNSELPRGTKIKLKDEKYLYFFVHWIQNKIRTDLDHSFQCFNKNWSHETVYFGNQANGYIKQSGDITNAPAPKGATEYGRIDLKKIPDGVKYIVPSINVYSGEKFSETREARAGFFLSKKAEFSLEQDIVQYNLSQPAEFNMPFVLDVKNKEVIVLDYNNRQRVGWVADSYISDVKKVIKALNRKNYMTIGDLADLLSGDSNEQSLLIGNSEESGVNPEELFSLFSKPKEKIVEYV